VCPCITTGVNLSEFCADMFLCLLAGPSRGVVKLIILAPQTLIVPCGKGTLYFAVRFYTCLDKELVSLSW